MSGSSQWMLASTLGRYQGRNIARISAIASLLLGVSMMLSFPFSATWVPSVYLGINLVLSGASMIALARTLRELRSEEMGRAPKQPPKTESAA
jgi:uncharacterized membrane protein HdeD (DUF308 family)